ncbi:acid phosphatase 1 isoform X2 [Argentina anserina]|uniref:acid phosphatase 1 isoform X2 n=1 Tax=Argentina anserina TaxID=57926 RepID=UPI0021766E38|nr:acid phosphatase 1 isoform X2 [Potentilla anserina]
MIFFKLFLIFPFLTLAFSHEAFNPHLLPRPLIIDYPNLAEPHFKEIEAEVKLQCTSWRFSVEANNVNPWKTIPEECVEYVKDYVTGRGYGVDLERVSSDAGVYAKSVELRGDGKDVWVFDVDDTLLSNLPYYADHGYGSEVFDKLEFEKWVKKGMAPAIKSSLKLYEEVLSLGFKVILLTGRSEGKRRVTTENLINAGFRDWYKLILRASDDHGKLATIYKSEKRSEMEKEGYRILGNSGDQWSDLLGSSMSIRSFKLPNPMVLSQNYSRAGWRRNWTTQSADSFLLLYHTDWTTEISSEKCP